MFDTFDAAIFDMDGTVTDNMHLHQQAFVVFGTRYSLTPPPPDIAAGLSGRRNVEIFPVLFGRDMTAEELAAYSVEKELIYQELTGSLTPIRGLTELLGRLDERGVKVGLATSAPRMNVAPLLAILGLTGRFASITLGEEVAHGKPAPDIFLEAARRLGCAPERCLVFEDAYAGIAAAGAAGMRCVALATTHTREELRANAAPEIIVADYDEFLALAETGR